MKILISADIEGVSCIANTKELETPEAKRWMTEDVNAAIRGALAGGAAEIIVTDSHGKHNENILPDLLHQKAVLIRGGKNTGLYFLEGLDKSFDAVFLVGWHDRIGGRGILSHTFVSKQLRAIRLNDQEVGEAEIAAGLAGEFGVPVALVTGDDVFCEAMTGFLGRVETAVVKRALDRYVSYCYPFPRSRELIRDAAHRALKHIDQFQPYRFKTPVVLEFVCADYNIATTLARLPGALFKPPLTVQYETESFREAFDVLVIWRNLLRVAVDPN